MAPALILIRQNTNRTRLIVACKRSLSHIHSSVPSRNVLDREQSLGERRDADNTSRNEIRPLFALVKLAPPLHKHYLYPIKSIQ
jgi:hypothetical protein